MLIPAIKYPPEITRDIDIDEFFWCIRIGWPQAIASQFNSVCLTTELR